jgi:prepilin-type N-terminal cleavage/methylation domain-containing protein
MSRQRGFSLIELLFALLVLTVVITTTLAMFVERTSRGQQASETILAYQALSNEAEAVRRVRYTSLDALSDKFSTDTTILAPMRPFETAIDVSLLRPGVKRVKMTIRWRATREASVMLLRSDTGGTNLW